MNNSRKKYFKSLLNKNLDKNSLQYILNRFDEFGVDFNSEEWGL